MVNCDPIQEQKRGGGVSASLIEGSGDLQSSLWVCCSNLQVNWKSLQPADQSDKSKTEVDTKTVHIEVRADHSKTAGLPQARKCVLPQVINPFALQKHFAFGLQWERGMR